MKIEKFCAMVTTYLQTTKHSMMGMQSTEEPLEKAHFDSALSNQIIGHRSTTNIKEKHMQQAI